MVDFSLIVCFGRLLPHIYFEHYMLLVEGISLLLLESISADEVDAAENYLHMFVHEFETLYGVEFMTYNVHLLQHISSSVRAGTTVVLFKFYV